MTDRERLRILIEDLPEQEVHTALRFVEYLRQEGEGEDPLLIALRNAPDDDEPLTEEDLEALREAEEDVAQGRVVSHEQARRILLGDA